MKITWIMALILGLAGCADAQDDDDDDTIDTGDDDTQGDDDDTTPAVGEALYLEHCAFCHGDAGTGVVADFAPALSNPVFLESVTDEHLHAAIVDGRPGRPMPAWGEAWGGPLSDADVDALITWIRGWQQGDSVDLSDVVVSGDPVAGAGFFSANCAMCHGSDGIDPLLAPSVRNPWFLRDASDGYLRHTIATGRPPTAMVPIAGASDQDIDNAVALLRSWQEPAQRDPVPELSPDWTAQVNAGGPPADFSADVDPEDADIGIHPVHDALQAGQSFVLLDAQLPAGYVWGHVPGATNLPFYRLDEAASQLPQDTWIVVSGAGSRGLARRLGQDLVAAGFTQVAWMDEIVERWTQAGYPMVEGSDP